MSLYAACFPSVSWCYSLLLIAESNCLCNFACNLYFAWDEMLWNQWRSDRPSYPPTGWGPQTRGPEKWHENPVYCIRLRLPHFSFCIVRGPSTGVFSEIWAHLAPLPLWFFLQKKGRQVFFLKRWWLKKGRQLFFRKFGPWHMFGGGHILRCYGSVGLSQQDMISCFSDG